MQEMVSGLPAVAVSTATEEMQQGDLIANGLEKGSGESVKRVRGVRKSAVPYSLNFEADIIPPCMYTPLMAAFSSRGFTGKEGRLPCRDVLLAWAYKQVKLNWTSHD